MPSPTNMVRAPGGRSDGSAKLAASTASSSAYSTSMMQPTRRGMVTSVEMGGAGSGSQSSGRRTKTLKPPAVSRNTLSPRRPLEMTQPLTWGG